MPTSPPPGEIYKIELSKMQFHAFPGPEFFVFTVLYDAINTAQKNKLETVLWKKLRK